MQEKEKTDFSSSWCNEDWTFNVSSLLSLLYCSEVSKF